MGPTPPDFLLQGNVIVDVKRTNLNHPDFVNAQVNTVVDEFFQQNRMIIKDVWGVDQEFPFADRSFRRWKTGAAPMASWKLTQP